GPWKLGDIVGGRYAISGLLGKGGFGLVYLARDLRFGDSLCALKTLRSQVLSTEAARDAFKREALVWVGLGSHPHILQLDWVEEISQQLVLRMEYVPPDALGRVTLADHLEKAAGPLDAIQTLQWSIQFCWGMQHAIAHGLKCHRDVKPSNLLIAQNGALQIA